VVATGVVALAVVAAGVEGPVTGPEEGLGSVVGVEDLPSLGKFQESHFWLVNLNFLFIPHTAKYKPAMTTIKINADVLGFSNINMNSIILYVYFYHYLPCIDEGKTS
jgi:hypothetical protein